ncbi:MAG: amino acid transport protein [Myxococcota bacterium]
MDGATQLLVAMILGSFGAGYFVYGRSQKRVVATVAGLALMVVPGFIGNPIGLALLSLVLLIAPWFVRL